MAFKRSGVRFPSPPFFWAAAADMLRGSSYDAGIAQLVEHNLAKVGVAGSSPVSRSEGRKRPPRAAVSVGGCRAVSSVG